MPEASIAAVLADATEQLERNGIPYPRREATALWAACSADTLRTAEVFLRRADAADQVTSARFSKAVQRRAAGEPFAYVAGRAAFRSIDVTTDARALIPRPETEGLVDLVLSRVTTGAAADLGTGSGCIALALAVEGSFRRVVAVDISTAALALAAHNVARTAAATPVELVEGDLLQPLGDLRCSVIVSNPPYLTDAEWESLDPAVRAYEPRLALASGADGLDATRAILAGAAGYLAPGGLLALEIDERRADQVQTLAVAQGWRDVTVHQDLFGRPRYLLAHPT